MRRDSKVDIRKIRRIGERGGCLRVILLCLGYIYLCKKLLEEKMNYSD